MERKEEKTANAIFLAHQNVNPYSQVGPWELELKEMMNLRDLAQFPFPNSLFWNDEL
jgi:hypothetical protein